MGKDNKRERTCKMGKGKKEKLVKEKTVIETRKKEKVIEQIEGKQGKERKKEVQYKDNEGNRKKRK